MIAFHFPNDDDQEPAPHFDRRSLLRTGGVGLGALLLGACRSAPSSTGGTIMSSKTSASTATSASGSTTAGAASSTTTIASAVASAPSATPTTTDAPATMTGLPGFAAFADSVKVIADGDYWLVESNGMPAHQLMVGIISWQQQVPVPQPYTGSNAWKIPTKPTVARIPVSAKTSLYRGAIALAVNGVPIFNALNNRGDDAFLVGELDAFGGHAGRADDYHYHAAPFHLQNVDDRSLPIAYALDGFALYGETEPDGSPVGALDELNGHIDAAGRYHYHGTRTYPYINGGMRGVVTVQADQIEPQAKTKPFRPAGSP